MKFLIFGVTGLDEKRVITQAFVGGHKVIAFVRSRDRICTEQDNLRVVEGDITNQAAIMAAMRGQDAVVSNACAAKPWCRSPAIFHDVINNIAAMKENGIDRLIYQAALGVGDSRDAVRSSVTGL